MGDISMKSKSIVRVTPDLVPAAMTSLTGPWFPGTVAVCGPVSIKPTTKPASAAFSDSAATASSAEAARRAVIESMRRNPVQNPPKTLVSAASFVAAGMPVYLPVNLEMKSVVKAKIVIDASTRTIANMKETVTLNPRLSVFIGG